MSILLSSLLPPMVALTTSAARAHIPPETTAALRGPAGFAVLPGFLSTDQIHQLKEDVAELQSSGRFSVAGVGEAATKRIDGMVRKCEQCFIYPRVKHSGGGRGRDELYSLLDGVRTNIESGTGVQLDGLLTEGLYASYPNGGYYRRHIDSYPGTPQEIRRFSFLLYCNTEWQPSDGGCLRIHTDGGGEVAPAGVQPSYVDIEPRAGTLVLFRSDIPHEVLETSAERLAVAGWFNAPPQGSSVRRSLIAALGSTVVVGSALKFGALHGGSGD
eukprot:CAMPEP_0174724108 /NCGR_PEP_ID=MMETSP1094-20130205/42627_1 /TAXON_ID=156173 /ORGANISM="Chrysochromulina brevifilum, Strain UTEX LB 985" /LENGTH=271 /DNA_ID=CAMNT_0015925275 /DNA_START=8 /DNA_END=823 /DNA_ORIENTATION=+